MRRPDYEDLRRVVWLSAPALSPDGETAAYVRAESDYQTGKNIPQVWEIPTAGGDAAPVSRATSRQTAPVYSPDDRWLAYLSDERDWLLTSAVEGEDCTHPDHLADPKRLCDLLAETLHTIHGLDTAGCPVKDHRVGYFATAEANYRKGEWDLSYCDGAFATPEEAFAHLQANRYLLQKDTLLHGDYCLPNVMLKNWQVSGIIDLGNGGVGDRHVDLYWGAWTLWFNLKTDAYRERFFDAYGRGSIDEERLLLVSAAECFG